MLHNTPPTTHDSIDLNPQGEPVFYTALGVVHLSFTLTNHSELIIGITRADRAPNQASLCCVREQKLVASPYVFNETSFFNYGDECFMHTIRSMKHATVLTITDVADKGTGDIVGVRVIKDLGRYNVEVLTWKVKDDAPIDLSSFVELGRA